jgi:energy-coupling factor transporter ATP-binding protein EcfA2
MYLHSLSLENVKNFSKLCFPFQRPNGSYAGWNVFVGGNASGKTTLLRIMALALSGDVFGRQLSKDPAGWISKGSRKARAIAEVLYDDAVDGFTGRGRPPHNPVKCGVKWEEQNSASVKFSKVEQRTEKDTRIGDSLRGPWNPNARGWFSCGYGPMRRLTGSSAEAMRDAVGSGLVPRFISLFREDVALSESEIWLKNLQFKALEKDRAAKSLVEIVKDFLNDGLLPAGFVIENITSDHVYMETRQGQTLPMRDLSEGYRCVYALMLDIIRNMVDVYGENGLLERDDRRRWVVTKPGILLIDEVETHLHPKWQQTICFWLKERFPKVQFFVTTHSPLIVQAADPGGVYFLPAPGESRKAHRFDQHEYDRIVMGRAEKVLLGDAFGLSHTRGTWALAQMERYRLLAAKKQANALCPDEQREYEQLSRQLEIEFGEVA